VKKERIQLEICAASAEDCVVAEQGGADRVEVNSALLLGGLTPSLGTLREARKAVRIPIIAMLRPRPGGFCYSRTEFAVLQQDLDLALAEGADGVAFGILNADGTIDRERCRQVVKMAGQRAVGFHRAFDVVPDPLAALEQLIDLGVTRFMTSGQEASAYNGAANIAQYLRHAAGRIEILPAGGINRFTVADVVSRTGCNQVHASLSGSRKDPSVLARPQVSFGGTLKPPEDQFGVTDPGAVAGLRRLLG
jgi:copper homeostasis protein